MLTLEFTIVRKRRSNDDPAPRPRKRARAENSSSPSSTGAAAPGSDGAGGAKRSQRTTVEDVPEEVPRGPAYTPAETTQTSRANDADGEEESSSPTRPTDALRRKCPLCFGGARPQLQHTK